MPLPLNNFPFDLSPMEKKLDTRGDFHLPEIRVPAFANRLRDAVGSPQAI
jgi:hypothetical protein